MTTPPGGNDPVVRTTLLGAPIERLLNPPETPAEVLASVERIGAIIEALPRGQRRSALEEARTRIENPSSSLRKLEKRLRQTAISTTGRQRAARLSNVAPDVEITDVGGSVRFRRFSVMPVTIDGRTRELRIAATIVGGPLERVFLTASDEDFLALAESMLARELETTRTNTSRIAGSIEQLIDQRRMQRLYDHPRMHEIIERAISTSYDLSDAIEQIRYELRPLDRAAAERERVRALVEEHGLIAYREYFPRARSLDRELILYAGPTNSGKTWRALNDLVQGANGAYLAPLRLLALEGQTEIEKRGFEASYLTGEERDIRPGANFIASTIEMLNPNTEWDTVVIDEVQLLTDRDRGWAWCQALVGAPGKRIIMTGSPDCIPLVQAIADYLDEPLTVHHLSRYTPVDSLPKPVRLQDVTPGTAIIAFSRRDVLRLKADLENRFPVAVIYGNLTPEVRREEARRFRTGEAKVLVATDSIALGLNLPIETVVFSTLQKWDGEGDVQLEPWQILQIGGRAGRYGHREHGHVGAVDARDARRIQQVFDPSFEPPARALQTMVRPSADHIEVIAAGLKTTSLAHSLSMFQRGMTFDSDLLVPGVDEDMINLAKILDEFRELSLAHRLQLAAAPVDARSEWMLYEFRDWMALHAAENPVALKPLAAAYRKERAGSDVELRSAESEAKRLTLYAWLSYRYPASFPDLDLCSEQRVALDKFIERSLAQKESQRRSASHTDRHRHHRRPQRRRR
jgi:hypothetical protein